jgi:hypothetical protein
MFHSAFPGRPAFDVFANPEYILDQKNTPEITFRTKVCAPNPIARPNIASPASNGAISIPMVYSADRVKSVTKAMASVVRSSGSSVRRRVLSVGELWWSSGANCRNRRSIVKRMAIQPR